MKEKKKISKKDNDSTVSLLEKKMEKILKCNGLCHDDIDT